MDFPGCEAYITERRSSSLVAVASSQLTLPRFRQEKTTTSPGKDEVIADVSEPHTVASVATCHPKSLQHEILGNTGEYGRNMGENATGYDKRAKLGSSLKPSSAGFSHPVFGASSEVVQHSWPREGPQITEKCSVTKQSPGNQLF